MQTELDEFGAEDSDSAAEAGGMASHVGGPEREARAASEVPEEVLANKSVRIDLPREAAPTAAAPPTAAATPAAALAKTPTPEAWYDAIAALREAGRNAEADAELARFEAAYPDWIKQHGRHRP